MRKRNTGSTGSERMAATSAYIGIGSNVGDRLANLQQAVERLDAGNGISVTGVSRVYMTEPVGDVNQERFFNAVVQVTTTLEPIMLRSRCKEIEQELGRPERYRRWSPRTIDLDILLYGARCVSSDILVIPHAELHRRKFVLIPLLDLGNPTHPGFGTPVSQLVRTCGDPSVPIRLTERLHIGS